MLVMQGVQGEVLVPLERSYPEPMAQGEFAEFSDIAFSAASRLTNASPEDQADVAQEALLTLVRLGGVPEPSAPDQTRNPKAFIETLVRNKHINRYNRQKKRASIATMEELPFADHPRLGHQSTPDTIYEANEVLDAIADLPEPFADVARLRSLGYSVIETADILGLPEGTVSTRYMRGLNRVREQTRVYDEPDSGVIHV